MSLSPKVWTRRLLLFAASALAIPAAADEIRLKDGKKLYGVIVAFEDNMFKVKTDFGYVLVEKDKIAAIIPTTPAPPKPGTKTEAKPAAKKEVPADSAKPVAETKKAAAKEEARPITEPAVDAVKETGTAPRPAAPGKREKTAAKPSKENGAAMATPVAPANTASAAPRPADTPAAPPKEPEPPANREEVQGNAYINYTHSFRMYKAPSWSVLDDARRALPNAIVALGTSSESTLMVVGKEKTKEPLDTAAAAVERRLQEAYENYRRLEQKKKQVGGLPAVEYRYRGTEGEHDWSGTLVVIARGKDIFTVLGVTHADTDLIQIQENVIARAITSLDFSAH